VTKTLRGDVIVKRNTGTYNDLNDTDTYPDNPDTDNDRLSDGLEVNVLGTILL
jgi:hypothetical protein